MIVGRLAYEASHVISELIIYWALLIVTKKLDLCLKNCASEVMKKPEELLVNTY